MPQRELGPMQKGEQQSGGTGYLKEVFVVEHHFDFYIEYCNMGRLGWLG